MIKEILDSLKDTAKERIKSPFIGAFVVSWCIYNWEIFLRIYYHDNKDINNLIEIIKPILADESRTLNPLLVAISYIIVGPFFTTEIQKWRDKFFTQLKKSKLNDEKSLVEARGEISNEKQKIASTNEILKKKEEIENSQKNIDKKKDYIEKLNRDLELKKNQGQAIAKLDTVNKEIVADNSRLTKEKTELEDKIKNIEISLASLFYKDTGQDLSTNKKQSNELLLNMAKKEFIEKDKDSDGNIIWKIIPRGKR